MSVASQQPRTVAAAVRKRTKNTSNSFRIRKSNMSVLVYTAQKAKGAQNHHSTRPSQPGFRGASLSRQKTILHQFDRPCTNGTVHRWRGETPPAKKWFHPFLANIAFSRLGQNGAVSAAHRGFPDSRPTVRPDPCAVGLRSFCGSSHLLECVNSYWMMEA